MVPSLHPSLFFFKNLTQEWEHGLSGRILVQQGKQTQGPEFNSQHHRVAPADLKLQPWKTLKHHLVWVPKCQSQTSQMGLDYWYMPYAGMLNLFFRKTKWSLAFFKIFAMAGPLNWPSILVFLVKDQSPYPNHLLNRGHYQPTFYILQTALHETHLPFQ